MDPSAGGGTVLIAWGVPLPAPAKLNLFLHVVGRRADGYHRLQTVFRFLDYADRVTITRRADREIRLVTPLTGVPDGSNLVIRAALALRANAAPGSSAEHAGIDIVLDKRIPMGGGLGGGSSDAATVLLALNRLWDARLGIDQLSVIGLGLGADVPVFVHGHSAFAEGVGEALEPLYLAPAWYLVLMPQVSVPTGEIFADPDLTRDSEETTISAFFAAQNKTQRGFFGHNDLEPVVRRRYREVAEHLDWLGRFGPARMTGSGACVFAQWPSESEARAVEAQLPEGMRGFVARGVDVHPLHAAGLVNSHRAL
jgi:4-diphosphocytidyl-2-C-methyl-D-erythritol kinase